VTGVLASYLRRRVGAQTLALLVLLTALMQLLELLNVTTDILDRSLGVAGVLYYMLLRTPSEVVLALPLSVLLGAMSTFHAMARSHEITAIRSAGVSLNQFVLYLLPVSALLAILQFVLSEHVVPRAETELKRWWDATAPSEDAPVRRWVHVRTGPLSFEGASPDGRRLEDVQIYMRGADGLFNRRISASAARFDGSRWWLENIEDMSVTDGRYSPSADAARLW
jgi:lipopolysaccharide export system permease protein